MEYVLYLIQSIRIFTLISHTYLYFLPPLPDQIKGIGDFPLRNLLDQFGGWPVTKKNWEPPNMSIEVLLGKIKGDFNEGVLSDQWVGPDDKNSSMNILQVRQSKSTHYFVRAHPKYL